MPEPSTPTQNEELTQETDRSVAGVVLSINDAPDQLGDEAVTILLANMEIVGASSRDAKTTLKRNFD